MFGIKLINCFKSIDIDCQLPTVCIIVPPFNQIVLLPPDHLESSIPSISYTSSQSTITGGGGSWFEYVLGS
jgi:hypothetical protein